VGCVHLCWVVIAYGRWHSVALKRASHKKLYHHLQPLTFNYIFSDYIFLSLTFPWPLWKSLSFVLVSSPKFLHHVSKNRQNCFCHNFVKFLPTLIIFGKQMVKTIGLRKVHSFSTSSNFCQCITMWNTDAPNCCITLSCFLQ